MLLSSLIAVYAYIADSDRLRLMAQTYLSGVLAGEVRIGHARLSIFQGLTLEDVRVYTANEYQPDALLFSARSLRLNYALGALLRGQVQATQIIATQPEIRLIQNLDTGSWNYQRLFVASTERPSGHAAPNAPALPEIILRDGEIENGQVHDGRYSPLGTVWLEGRLGPSAPDGRYSFTIQSRAAGTNPAGPQVSGWFNPDTDQAKLSLHDFRFGPSMREMLPEKVRLWCQNHHLEGELNIDDFTIAPGAGGGSPKFDLHMRIDGMTLDISPDEWRTHEQNLTVERIKQSVDTLENLGISDNSVIGHLTRFAESPPLHLRIARGELHFSDSHGIQIDNLVGGIESSPFCIQGSVADYSPESAFALRLFCPENSVMNFPSNPDYVRSLPVPLQEFYDRFKPVGTGRLDLKIARSVEGGDVAVDGEINVINGQFTFDHFPYPLRHVHGSLLIHTDPRTGRGTLDIPDLTANGMAGGPNANAVVHLAGTFGPFNHECEAHLTISGKQITSEPAIVAAFPTQTQHALKLFDAPGHGKYPTFHGDFVCDVERTLKNDLDWDVVTKLNIDRCAGRLVTFPYPINDMSMKLNVYGDHIDILGAHMQHGEASLSLSGKVSWKPTDDDNADVPLFPHLSVAARNVPIDRDLLDALPADRSEWIRAAGLAGLVDINGQVLPDPKGDVDLNFNIHVHDGQLITTGDGSHALGSVTADAQLTNTALDVPRITCRRGSANLSGAASVSWQSDTPSVHIKANANDLLLDPSLRQLLPLSGKAMWDELNPAGTIDADAVYQSPDSLKLQIRPRELSVKPAAFPWQLDHLSGSASFTDGQIHLDNLSARHGDAIVFLSGTGSSSKNDQWALHLRGKSFPINSDFLHIAPKPLADLFGSINLTGSFDFDFSKLLIHNDKIEFAMKLSTPSASLDAGLHMSKVAGSCDLAGSIQDGKPSDLTGDFDFSSLDIAGRPASDLSFKLKKPADRDIVVLYDLSGSIADGSLAGQMSFNTTGTADDHYTINLVLRDADISALAPDTEHDIHGQLSASLDLEGLWSDPKTRIGRGDVLVTGKQLYKIPILLGVSQIANLSLPLNEPFTQGTARYAVQGQNVIFDSIELKAANMQMTGSGQMNFDTKKFNLLFTTNNPNWPKLPVINDLLSAAEHELLQIRVSGTIEEPKVSAGLFSAVPTTIDRVMGK
ncbi:MAG TPA: hypothetical protein VG722_12140 [Tepidisphaeraceae bacterium]|nr:hypothetical protein [Tepidisphaeraceae bacterium]